MLSSCSSPPPAPQSQTGLPRNLSREASKARVVPKGGGESRGASVRSGGKSPTPRGYSSLGSFRDGRDSGIPYVDIMSIQLQQDGPDLQVIVDMAGDVPDHTTGEREVVGLAIDLFTKKGNYQLFASGENDGWFGYLDTPKGMKSYPGAFEIAGTRFVFTVPLDSVGDPKRGRFSAYCELSSADGYAEDYAPDDGSKVPFGS